MRWTGFDGSLCSGGEVIIRNFRLAERDEFPTKLLIGGALLRGGGNVGERFESNGILAKSRSAAEAQSR